MDGHRRSADRPGDQEILSGLRAQDPAALEILEQRYGRLVRSWARSEGADTDDVVQDVLLRAWRSGPRMDDETFLPSWLKTVTTNVLKDRWRAAGRRPSIPVGLEIDSTTPDPTTESNSRIAVEQIMEGLVPRERDVLSMLYLSDLSLHDAAEQLGLSEEATKSLAARARRRLRGRIERLVAVTPAGAMALLVGRAAEATTGIWRAAGALGAAAAAATALAAGTVTYHRAHTPAEAPAPAIVRTVPVSSEESLVDAPRPAPAPTTIGEQLTGSVATPADDRPSDPGTGEAPTQPRGNVDDAVATPPRECPHVDGEAPDDREADNATALPDNAPKPPRAKGDPAPSPSEPGCPNGQGQEQRSQGQGPSGAVGSGQSAMGQGASGQAQDERPGGRPDHVGPPAERGRAWS